MTTVSILIPSLQERDFIRGCVESIQQFKVPPDVSIIDIMVLDGLSTDETREIVREMAAQDARICLIDNPGRIQSTALNIGIAQSTSDYIMRLDAHSSYPPDYLCLCVETARRTNADNVGGLLMTQARGESYQAALVQALTTHRFGVGNAGFRIGIPEGPTDTVPYGFFRRDVFARLGLFDERLVRAQDYEINRRIVKAGGKVWLNPAIQVFYYQQPTLLKFYCKQIEKEAPYNAYLWYVAPYALAARHAITGLFAAGVLAGSLLSALWPPVGWLFGAVMLLYALVAITSAAQQAIRYRRPLHLVLLPVCFFLYHFLHGCGVLYGLLRLATGTAPVQGKPEPWTGAGRFRAWAPPQQQGAT